MVGLVVDLPAPSACWVGAGAGVAVALAALALLSLVLSWTLGFVGLSWALSGAWSAQGRAVALVPLSPVARLQ
eukprot:12229316-Alexandrium_andersonii.AAC.1